MQFHDDTPTGSAGSFARGALALGVFALGIGGCGLFSSDILSVSFDLPPQHYVFDTATAGSLPAGTVPALPCTADATCCAAAAALGGYDCTKLFCDTSAGAGVCSAKVTVEPAPQTIDLGMQSELSGFSGQTLASVSISQIDYDVVSTLNHALPAVELFLAPQGATSTADPAAHKFGTVPAIPANATVTGGQVVLEPDAGATFSGYAKNFKTPFQFMSRTVVTVRGGDPAPMGKVDITVRGRVTAKPNL